MIDLALRPGLAHEQPLDRGQRRPVRGQQAGREHVERQQPVHVLGVEVRKRAQAILLSQEKAFA